MIAWRICKRKYSERRDVLSGEGAKDDGGRWNEPGHSVVYASSTASLALLENLVHMTVSTMPRTLVAVKIIIPNDIDVRRISAAHLDTNWRDVDNANCIAQGSAWLRSNDTLVLVVPSAVNPLEENVLLNPAHRDIARCQTEPPVELQFDPRIVALFNPAS